MHGNLIIKNAAQLVTCSGFKAKQGKEMSNLDVIDDGALVIEDGIIRSVGKTDDILADFDEKNISMSKFDVIDAAGKAKAILGKGQLAPMVAARHRTDLGHGLVAFIYE